MLYFVSGSEIGEWLFRWAALFTITPRGTWVRKAVAV